MIFMFGKKKINNEDKKRKFNRPLVEPISYESLSDDIAARADRVSEEIKNGFTMIGTFDKSVTFWGSARTMPHEDDYKIAVALAGKVANAGYTVVTGGGPGIMGAGNCGAHDAGGKSVGLTIKLPMEQKTNPCVSHYYDFHYFFTRKLCMAFAAEAYLFFPGGFGTLDELFEILTLVQTKKITPAPVIILVGSHYWNDLDKFIKKQLLAKEKISEGDENLYTITDDHEEILELVRNAPFRKSA